LECILLRAKEANTEGMETDLEAIIGQLAQADIIVGPWVIAVACGAAGAVDPIFAQAVVSSSARKFLIPIDSEGWNWAGVERWNSEAMIRQTVRATKQMATGELVRLHHPLGVGAIIGIVIGVLVLLSLFSVPLLYLFGM
jgi:hypothetical protein